MKHRWLLLPLLLWTLPLTAQAPFGLLVSQQLRSSFTLLGSGARAAAMGGAFTAVADDATAASFNPAGLAQLSVPEASIVIDRINLVDRYRDFVSTDQVPDLPLTPSDTHFAKNDLNFISFTAPFRFADRGWAIQFSSQKLVDFSYEGDRTFDETDLESNPLFRLHQISNQSGSIRLYSVSLATEATRRMLLGVTVNHWKGDWSFESVNSEFPLAEPEDVEFISYSQENALSGWNFDFGMLLRYKYANVGVRYRSSFDADYSFETEIETNIESPLRPLPNTETKLKWPSTLNLGVALKPTENLIVALDYGRTDWSKMLFRLSEQQSSINFFDLRSEKETAAEIAEDWHIGAEYLFFFKSAVLPVRAGWFREPQPVRDEGTGERIISQGFAGGAGIKIGWFAMDFSYLRKSSDTRISLFSEADEVASGQLLASSRGRLNRQENRFFLSFIFQVPKDSIVRKWIHMIFVGPVTTRS